jgi:hypothetical protein
MNRNLIFIVWSWLVISALLEAVLAYDLSSVAWFVRGGVESVIAISAALPLLLVYMGLWKEHIGLKMFIIVSLFFSMDLILIWTASIVHT